MVGMAGDVVVLADTSVEASSPTRRLGLMKLRFLDTTIDDWTGLLILG